MVYAGGLQVLVVGRVAAAAGGRAPAGAGDHRRHAVGDGVGGQGDTALLGVAVDEDDVEVLGRSDVGHGLDVAVVGGQRGESGVHRDVDGGLVGDVDVDLGGLLRGAEDVDADDGDLDLGGRLDVEQLGAVLAVGAQLADGLGVPPGAPGTVGLLGADVGGDVAVVQPGDGEHGELLVAGELLHRARAGDAGLLGDGGVVDDDVVTGGEGGGGLRHLDGAGADVLGLEDLVSAEGGGDDEGEGQDNGQRRVDAGLPCGDTASLLHGGDSLGKLLEK